MEATKPKNPAAVDAVADALNGGFCSGPTMRRLVEELIERMSDDERLLTQAALKDSTIPAPRNLFFNYKTQKWIG